MIILPTEKRFDWQHAPFVLIGLIALNILVFVFYQSGDNRKLGETLQQYAQNGYLEQEWPIYEDYLEREELADRLSQLRDAYNNRYYQPVAVNLLLDAEFFPYLQRGMREQLAGPAYDEWLSTRRAMQDRVASLSARAHGLIPAELEVTDLISHQFLHGGLMHLVGNLVFLAICGFAVEAAIGHWRFLAFYLLSGLAGGLAHALFNLDSAQPLVGASGAISGVMAMYLAVFRFKRIEFFYWIFFLVGYIRAPALLLLPVYIGKELYSYYTDVNSNVAFLAHTGGFVAGAVLIGVAWLIQRDMFNRDYIETDQDEDPVRKQLAAVYGAIDRFQFRTARTALERLIRDHGLDFERASLRYNLNKPVGGKARLRAAYELLRITGLLPREMAKVAAVCRDEPDALATLNVEERIKLGMRLAGAEQIEAAEALFEQLQSDGAHSSALGVFARKLSVFHESRQNAGKRQHYARLADAMMEAG